MLIRTARIHEFGKKYLSIRTPSRCEKGRETRNGLDVLAETSRTSGDSGRVGMGEGRGYSGPRQKDGARHSKSRRESMWVYHFVCSVV